MTDHTIHVVPTVGALPHRAHQDDAGADLYAAHRQIIPWGTTRTIDTGTAVSIPRGHVGLVFARSSLHRKFNGAKLANSVGVIDATYTGNIMLDIWAPDGQVVISEGDRIAQLVILPIALPQFVQVDHLADTPRGGGGFGSTGTH